jgi:HAD superfamily hydrolase (TIGR01509 family)
MLKAVIFDMDGVIVDSEPYHQALEKELFQHFGIAISESEHLSFLGMTNEQMWTLLKAKYQLPLSVKEMNRFDREKRVEFMKSKDEISSVPGVVNLIQELSGIKLPLAVASSSPMAIIEIFMAKFELKKYFQKLISGDFVPSSKPEPDIFLYAAELLKVIPENCIVIEDSQNGILAAQKAHMKCVGYQNPNSGNQDLSLANLVISNFAEINYNTLRAL